METATVIETARHRIEIKVSPAEKELIARRRAREARHIGNRLSAAARAARDFMTKREKKP